MLQYYCSILGYEHTKFDKNDMNWKVQYIMWTSNVLNEDTWCLIIGNQSFKVTHITQ
jgi:hypothetical protein